MGCWFYVLVLPSQCLFFKNGIDEDILKPEDFVFKKSRFRNSLAVQWLELYTLIADDLASISGWGTEISQASLWALEHGFSSPGTCGLSHPVACGILSDQGLNLVPCIGRQILTHWTTRDVPSWLSYAQLAYLIYIKCLIPIGLLLISFSRAPICSQDQGNHTPKRQLENCLENSFIIFG